MWLSKRQSAQSTAYAEEGTLTINSSALTETSATMRSRNAADYSPYGYTSRTPVGEAVLLINGSGGCRAGVRMAEKQIAQGEIEIESLGGAKIRLCNDGSIRLNGVVITADGRIINIEGDTL